MSIPESEYLEAFQTAGLHLQTCMDESKNGSFGWIKMRPSKPAFADFVFVSGQRMYAVLLVAMSSQKKAEGEEGVAVSFEIPREQRELLLQESERYRLEPVIFPMWLGIMKPLTTGWNLFSLRDMSPVQPGAVAGDPPVPMSEWELCSFCVGQVIQEIEDKGLSIFSYQDIPGVCPNLWFRDAEGNRAWVAVVPAFGTEHDHIPQEALDLRRKLPGCAGYVARMAVTSMAHPGAPPTRGELLSLNYDGLEKLP